MNFATIYKALRRKVLTVREQLPIPDMPFQMDNMALDDGLGTKSSPQPEPAGGSWAKVSIIPGSSDQVELGTVQNARMTGVLSFQIFTEFQKGDGDVIEAVDSIIQSMSQTTLTEDGFRIILRTAYPVRVGRAGKWWQMNVICPWYADVR